jgi:hypothetical protein
MKKYLIILLILIVIPVGYILISPLFIESVVDEKMEDIITPEESAKVISEGMFTGIGIHRGAGTVKLIQVGEKYYVRFEDDFRVTNGPDLFVYFGKDGQHIPETRFGALKGNVGGQNYEIPENLDPKDFNEIWVWCRAFATPFAKAELIY